MREASAASGIPVLAYHRIAAAPADALHPDTYVHPRDFARQLALLKGLGYRAIDPRDYFDRVMGGGRPLPPKPVLITFDDGSASTYAEALPALERHGFKAALFMVSSGLGGPAAWDGERPGCGHRQLDAVELKALDRAGWVIGSHTETHARLTALPPEDARRELSASKAALEGVLGRELSWFAYPYGSFSPALRDAVAGAGYRIGFATEQGDAHALSLPRRIISGRTGALKFLWRLRQARRLSSGRAS